MPSTERPRTKSAERKSDETTALEVSCRQNNRFSPNDRESCPGSSSRIPRRAYGSQLSTIIIAVRRTDQRYANESETDVIGVVAEVAGGDDRRRDNPEERAHRKCTTRELSVSIGQRHSVDWRIVDEERSIAEVDGGRETNTGPFKNEENMKVERARRQAVARKRYHISGRRSVRLSDPPVPAAQISLSERVRRTVVLISQPLSSISACVTGTEGQFKIFNGYRRRRIQSMSPAKWRTSVKMAVGGEMSRSCRAAGSWCRKTSRNAHGKSCSGWRLSFPNHAENGRSLTCDGGRRASTGFGRSEISFSQRVGVEVRTVGYAC